MKNRLLVTALISIIASFLTSSFIPANAQGMVIQPIPPDIWRPPIGPWPAQPITLDRETVEIKLDNQFAHVKTSQIFKNNTPTVLEGTWIFPVPRDANISNFSLWLDGKELSSETLPADQARSIYQQIVSSMRDPGLLEYMGDGMIRAHIYPIPANGTKQIDMEYDWLVPIDSGLMRLEFPLKLDGYSIDTINTLAISVEINSPDSLGSIYSPTHEIDIKRDGANRAVVGFEKDYTRPTGDFVLYISRPVAPLGCNLLTHATGTGEGFFLALIAPEYNEKNVKVIPKDFVLVLDTSGSMSGNKIEQAKEALGFIFNNLNSDDRFSLITFSTDVRPYFKGWSEVSRANLDDVRDYVKGIEAGGSTNIDGAMAEALKYEPEKNRPMYVIFLTDGLPTAGETNTSKIVENTNAKNSELGARIFCFGVGDDVDYQFIDLLARENGGYTSSVGPDENLEQPLSDFYAKIKSPVITGIDIDISGTRIYDMLPDKMPDLFLGSQLVLCGRYNGTGDGMVRIAGMVGDKDVTYSYPVNFGTDRGNDFIPRQWATRRVGYLMNQIRLYGENTEIVDEVIDLAKHYGIITPYTSMLVTEDETLPPMLRNQIDHMAYDRGGGGGGTGALGAGIAPAAPMAERQKSEALQQMESGEKKDFGNELGEAVQYAGDKTFYVDADGVWVDSTYVEDDFDLVEIDYLSDEYFKLIDDNPDIKDYLAVADSLIVVFNDKAYKIVPAKE
ncbi:MAG: VIT domain-containing protein [bacterium]